jgi:TetR/AcrR family transcriptional regulator, fatty acid metabolism regulator protein
MKGFTDRQKEIIEASIEIIAERGIQQLTIKNISRSMNISEPAIYRHFASKMNILLAILANFKKCGQLVSKDIMNSRSLALEKIHNIFKNHFKQFIAKPALAAVIFSEEIFQNDKELAIQVNSIMQANQDLLVKIIKEGQKRGEIRNDIPAQQIALIILGALRLLVTRWRSSHYTFDLAKKGADLWVSLEKMSSA